MMNRRGCLSAFLLTVAVSAPAWSQNYVTGANTGAESKIDNAPDTVAFPLNVSGGGSYSLNGGIFYLKGGTITSGSITLTLYSGTTALASMTLTNAQFCAPVSNCQSYAYHTFTFPSPAVLAAGSYSLVLTSTATPQQNDAYFVKGGGTVFNVSTSASGTADLILSKSASPSNFQQGSTASYAIQATNIGSAATSGTITVSDTLDSNLTFVSSSGSGWTCGLAGQVVTCTNPAVLAAGASAPTITITVMVQSNSEATVTNNAAVSGGGETNAANDTFQLVTSVSSPNLSVSKSATPASFSQGGNAAYSIVVTNNGNTATSGTMTVTDTLDSNLTFVNATGSNWTCSAAGQVVTCTSTTSIAASAAASAITLNVTINPNGETSVTNNVSVSGGGQAAGLSNSFRLTSNVATGSATGVPISGWPTLIGLAAAGVLFLTKRKFANHPA